MPRIGTAPINWNNEDLTLAVKVTGYPELLDRAREAGYEGIEWATSLPSHPGVLRPDLAARGLELTGCWHAMDLTDSARHAGEAALAGERAQALARLGVRYLVCADRGSPERLQLAGRVAPADGLPPERWNALVEGLRLVAHAVAPSGLRCVFHNHVGTWIETEDETARLLEALPAAEVAWCLDTGHLAYAGGDVSALLGRFTDRVEYVHVKDVDGAVLEASRREGLGFRAALERFIFTTVGAGILDLAGVLGRLRDAGYAGWITVEQDTTRDDPTVTARRSREAIREVMGW